MKSKQPTPKAALAMPEHSIAKRIEAQTEQAIFDVMVEMNLTQSIAHHIIENALNRYVATL
jgi:hypothetical protein